MVPAPVDFAFWPYRFPGRTGRFRAPHGMAFFVALLLSAPLAAVSQASIPASAEPAPAAASSPGESGPIALVPLDNNPESAAKVTGAIEVSSGKAVIGKSGTITSGTKTTE